MYFRVSIILIDGRNFCTNKSYSRKAAVIAKAAAAFAEREPAIKKESGEDAER